VPNAALQLLSPNSQRLQLVRHTRILPHLGCSAYPVDRPPTHPLRMPRPGASAAGGLSSRASPRQPTTLTTPRNRLQGLTTCFHPPGCFFFSFGRQDFDRQNQAVLGCYILCSCLYLVFAFQLLILTLFVRLRVKCAVGLLCHLVVPYLSLASDKWLWLLQDKSVFMLCYII